MERLSAAPKAPEIELGVGDDAAILLPLGGPRVTVTTDMLLDGVDFELSQCGYRAAGRKAMHKNLSDIAAMGAHPIAAFVSVALPDGFDESAARELLAGLFDAAQRHACPIAGGDTKRSPSRFVINVAIVGRAIGTDFVRRSGARPGDIVWVSGRLGGSILGHHLSFEPRFDVARAVVECGGVSAMIDLSDGLSTDLTHLCDRSGVGVEIDAAAIPIADAALELAATDGRSALSHALDDGEDYELLFTVRDPAALEAYRRVHPPLELTPIGRIVSLDDGRTWIRSGEFGHQSREPLIARGFEHRFSPPGGGAR